MNIFVGNLSFKTSEEQLFDLFASYGEVTSVKIITDKFSGNSRGFAFVEMPEQDEAQNAVDNLNDSEFDSRTMAVKEAMPKENDTRSRKKHY
ncbi:RNA recognition motif domain-containing protein [Flavobacterium lindanitolerans]|uniref:RNA recognition motif-containing protein n=1 Tax=Flavobacterium lindanitolerans TaxID=428988 RepID=A0A497UP50_9FLAO|nr:RNA-binding protein [Flavobacterium lindanitolerans]MBC8644327.1 RNA-binding protein [Flavobacterium lindanitolerans]PKW21137.1 RNA recognition motif-containing protein [Flavobacterium lindanitolerans]RLJ30225.1 RNA recognition motif-containing protein [Flavobacterium lindanitolerans]